MILSQSCLHTTSPLPHTTFTILRPNPLHSLRALLALYAAAPSLRLGFSILVVSSRPLGPPLRMRFPTSTQTVGGLSPPRPTVTVCSWAALALSVAYFLRPLWPLLELFPRRLPRLGLAASLLRFQSAAGVSTWGFAWASDAFPPCFYRLPSPHPLPISPPPPPASPPRSLHSPLSLLGALGSRPALSTALSISHRPRAVSPSFPPHAVSLAPSPHRCSTPVPRSIVGDVQDPSWCVGSRVVGEETC